MSTETSLAEDAERLERRSHVERGGEALNPYLTPRNCEPGQRTEAQPESSLFMAFFLPLHVFVTLTTAFAALLEKWSMATDAPRTLSQLMSGVINWGVFVWPISMFAYPIYFAWAGRRGQKHPVKALVAIGCVSIQFVSLWVLGMSC